MEGGGGGKWSVWYKQPLSPPRHKAWGPQLRAGHKGAGRGAGAGVRARVRVLSWIQLRGRTLGKEAIAKESQLLVCMGTEIGDRGCSDNTHTQSLGPGRGAEAVRGPMLSLTSRLESLHGLAQAVGCS